jgi:hypothetical protein
MTLKEEPESIEEVSEPAADERDPSADRPAGSTTVIPGPPEDEIGDSTAPQFPTLAAITDQIATDRTSTAVVPNNDPLLLEQLAFTVRRSIDPKLQTQRAFSAIDLYRRIDPSDAIESILARLAVGLTNAAMDSLDRAASIQQTLQGRQIELRLGHKSTAAIVDVLKLLRQRQGSGSESVKVGSVNVASGGQAIVGPVQSTPSQKTGQVERQQEAPIRNIDDLNKS